jgi:hypothetical protein
MPVGVAALNQFQRTQFDQKHKEIFKLNDTFQFPEIINMDRYLQANIELTASKRAQVKQWEHQIEKLEARLKEYIDYKVLKSQSFLTDSGLSNVNSQNVGRNLGFCQMQ